MNEAREGQPAAAITSHRVHFVGAGPGDPELLTLKAVRAIGEADVVLIDDLVNRAVLRHARPHARIIEVFPQRMRRPTLVHTASYIRSRPSSRKNSDSDEPLWSLVSSM